MAKKQKPKVKKIKKKTTKPDCGLIMAEAAKIMKQYESPEFVDKFLASKDGQEKINAIRKSLESISKREWRTKINAIMFKRQEQHLNAAVPRYLKFIENHPFYGRIWKGEKAKKKALQMAFMDSMSGGSIRPAGQAVSLEGHLDAYVKKFQADLETQITRFRPNLMGVSRDKKSSRLLVRALKGETVPDKTIAKLADTMHSIYERQRRLANKFGANIPKLESWALPQFHDGIKIAKVGRDAWVEKTKRAINTKYMVYNSAGDPVGDKLTPDQVDKFLKSVWANITTGGMRPVKFPKGMKHGYVPMHTQRSLHRYLHFDTADDWLKYSDEFGAPDVFNSLMAEINGMSKEIAVLSRYGPDYDLVIRQLKNKVDAEVGRGASDMGYNAYRAMMGRGQLGNVGVADFMSNLRAISIATKIGGATITAISDLGFRLAMSAATGVPVFKGMLRMIKGLNPLDKTQMELAQRYMVGVDFAISAGKDAFRYIDTLGHSGPGKLAEAVVRGSGLNHWTLVNRATFGVEMLTELGRSVKGGLTRRMRSELKRYGIDDVTWARMAKAGLDDLDGVPILDPRKLGLDDQVKLTGMISEMQRMVAPDANAKTRAFMYGSSKSGTAVGEFQRLLWQFKTFPVSVMLGPLSRALDGTPRSFLNYGASMVMGTTMLGFVSYQLKELLKGNQVNLSKDLQNPEVWGKAAALGGFAGIAGDMIMRSPDGKKLFSQLLASPTITDAEAVAGMLFSVPYNLGKGEKEIGEKFGQDAARAFRQFHPNFWPTRLAYDRAIKHQVNSLLDPYYEQTLKAQRTRLRKEHDKGMFWDYGRSPNVDKMFK